MRPASLLLRSLPLLLLLASASDLKAEKLVVVRSTAASKYLEKRMKDDKRQPQSYVFTAGRYFAGSTHDSSLDKTSFQTIAERLALDLRKQDFYPAASLAKADLLLVVHWGVTYGHNRDTAAMAMSVDNLASLKIESEIAQREWDEAKAAGRFLESDAAQGRLNQFQNETRSNLEDIAGNEPARDEDNATLLGLRSELEDPNTSPFGDDRLQALSDMTKEERYFVIVMAYDVPTLISRKKLKRVWTLRASIGSAGVNFHQALDRMGNIASRYFATKQDGVIFDHTGDRERKGRVDLGELIIIGPVESPK